MATLETDAVMPKGSAHEQEPRPQQVAQRPGRSTMMRRRQRGDRRMTLPATRHRIAMARNLLAALAAFIAFGGPATPSRALEPITVGYFGSDATLATFIAKDEGF